MSGNLNGSKRVMKPHGNVILMTVICIVIFWVFMTLRPAQAQTETEEGLQRWCREHPKTVASECEALRPASATEVLVLLQKGDEKPYAAFATIHESCEEFLAAHERNRKLGTWLLYVPIDKALIGPPTPQKIVGVTCQPLPQGLPNGVFPLETHVDLSKPAPAGHTLCFCLRERPSGTAVVVNFCRLNTNQEPMCS
jgi:hypothetical protein